MPFVLALDQGTTSSRAIVFDASGAIRASAQREFRQIYPQGGWVEHDAVEIWATQSGVMHDIPDGERWLGAPAQPDRQAKRQILALQQLPELIRRVADLERKLAAPSRSEPKPAPAPGASAPA